MVTKCSLPVLFADRRVGTLIFWAVLFFLKPGAGMAVNPLGIPDASAGYAFLWAFYCLV